MNPSPKALEANAHVKTARCIAQSIADDIEGRSGIGDEWCQIDRGTQREILRTWTEIIEGELSK